MHKAVKFGGIGLGVLFGGTALLLGGGYVWVEATWDADYSSLPAPAIHASTDPAVIAQGAYVVRSIGHCQACHLPAENGKDRSLPLDPLRLEGGYGMDSGPFGTFYPANLTSDVATGIGGVPDEVLARTLRHGVKRDGHLSLAMAMSIGTFSDEDLTAIVSYLRTVPPIANQVPPSELSFVSHAIGTMVGPHDEPVPKHVPEGAVSVERGAYIANGPGACYGCHSPLDLSTMTPAEPRFIGEPMALPDPTDAAFEFAVPNLTPDPETGIIANWTEDAFVARFRAGRVYPGSSMPWESFTQMTDADLRSVYQYLHGLPPTKHVTGPPRRAVGWVAPT